MARRSRGKIYASIKPGDNKGRPGCPPLDAGGNDWFVDIGANQKAPKFNPKLSTPI